MFINVSKVILNYLDKTTSILYILQIISDMADKAMSSPRKRAKKQATDPQDASLSSPTQRENCCHH